MSDPRSAVRGAAMLVLLTALLALRAEAADYFLTIGGGYAPSGNQVSLEKNVLFFRQVLAGAYPKASPPAHDIFFSDGDSPNRDVQYDDRAAHPVPEARRLLARLRDEEEGLGFRYRTHQVPQVRGPGRRAEVERWFAEHGPKLRAGDRLVLYVTGHGSQSEDERANPAANTIDLWDGDRLDVRELAALLDKLPAGVGVVAVMVQCYAGGFADLMFAGGQSDRGPAANLRCGFFATMPDRRAAGCTPDVNEANYEDYSSSFWAALGGRTRTGVAVARAAVDLDTDGAVSFAEAHAYVLLSDDSIDVPMTTSDRFLRLKSDPGASRGRLVSPDDMLPRLHAVASPIDRAVIDGLSTQLELGTQYRYAAAKELADSLHMRHKDEERREKSLRDEYDDARESILDALELRWPELRNAWDPAVDRILRDEGDAVVRAVKADPHYATFAKRHAELDAMSKADDALQAKWARCLRLLRVLERVALAHNLPHVADEETLARYRALMAAEGGTLGTAPRAKP